MSPCATKQQLERFLFDQLEPSEHLAVEAHIEQCDSCQQLLEQMTNLRDPAESLPSNRENDERIARLLDRVEAKGPRWGNHDDCPPGPNAAGFLIGGSEGVEPANGIRSPSSFEGYPRIDGLRIIREIGRGGMGIVYEAEDLRLNRLVALKVLPFHSPILAGQVKRFQREAQAAARLHHTNIVPVFGVGEQDGHHYYLMQYIDGFGLDAVLDELRRLREAESASLGTKCSERLNGPGRPDVRDPAGIPSHPTISVTDVARALEGGQFPESASLPPVGDCDRRQLGRRPPNSLRRSFLRSSFAPITLP